LSHLWVQNQSFPDVLFPSSNCLPMASIWTNTAWLSSHLGFTMLGYYLFLTPVHPPLSSYYRPCTLAVNVCLICLPTWLVGASLLKDLFCSFPALHLGFQCSIAPICSMIRYYEPLKVYFD
jgi:hypothetical protein